MPKRLLNLFGDNVEGRFKLLAGAVVAALSLIAVGSVMVYRFHMNERMREQTAENCMNIETLKAAVVGMLEDAEVASLRSSRDPAIRKAIEAYYNRQVLRFAPQDCPTRTGGP